MAEKTKLKSFFAGRRRKASLVAWTHLKNRAGEPRLKLQLSLPLLNENLQGMEDAIAEAFTVMAKDDSKISRTNLNVEMEGMTVDIFSTNESKRRSCSTTGGKFIKFSLVSSGEEDKRSVDLEVTLYMPANVQIRDWAWDHLHKDFHLEAIYSQTEMDFDGKEAEDDQDEDDEETDDEAEKPRPVAVAAKKSASAPPARKSGSGPKELAAFHQTQQPN